jgi:hypothetical protein
MTGIQALERIAPGLPMMPGKVERREFEYRHSDPDRRFRLRTPVRPSSAALTRNAQGNVAKAPTLLDELERRGGFQGVDGHLFREPLEEVSCTVKLPK